MSGRARENLLGFLLNALEDHEHEHVASALEADDQLRDELSKLHWHIAPLATDRDHHEPPTDLARRTCSELWSRAVPDTAGYTDGHGPERADESAQNRLEVCTSLATAATHATVRHEFAERDRSAADGGDAHAGHAPQPLSPLREFVSWRSWSVADVLVMTGIVLVASFLFFPALMHCRHLSRSAVCQNNLRQLGIALGSYSDWHRGLFPQIALAGPRSFPGIYAMVLHEEGHLSDRNVLYCPTAERYQPWAAAPASTLAELDQASGDKLETYQRVAGGDYAYHLGHFRDGVYEGARNTHRSFFPILADNPGGLLAAYQSDHHDGRGQNVLFEDMHVQYISNQIPRGVFDNFYTNRDGLIAPGNDASDAVLARSETKFSATLPPPR